MPFTQYNMVSHHFTGGRIIGQTDDTYDGWKAVGGRKCGGPRQPMAAHKWVTRTTRRLYNLQRWANTATSAFHIASVSGRTYVSVRVRVRASV